MIAAQTSTDAGPQGELLAHWQQDLAIWPSAAFLVDENCRVVGTNDFAEELGVHVGQLATQTIGDLATRATNGRPGLMPSVFLRFFRVEAEDFAGWFVENVHSANAATEAVLPLPGSAQATGGGHAPRLQLLSAIEEEKCRISLELQDGVGQQLAGVAFMAHSLANALRRQDNPMADAAESLVGMVSECVNRTRILSRGLWPTGTDRDSLEQAVRRLALDLEARHGVHCNVQISGRPRMSSNLAAHHLIAVLQDAAVSAIHNGNARNLVIRVEETGAKLAVSVTYDGSAVAIEPGSRSGGVGLVGMRLRAEAIGGTLTVQRLPSGESKILLVLPWGTPGVR